MAGKQKFNFSLADRPPMGNNIWYATLYEGRCKTLDEQFVKGQVDAMKNSGLVECGYNIFVVDDCWEDKKRDAQGRLQGDLKRFPSGMKALGDYIREHDMKFGIYTCAGSLTCQDYLASYGNEFLDAQTFADWGARLIKIDWCHTSGLNSEKQYKIWRDAILATGQDILIDICEWGDHTSSTGRKKVWNWGRGVGHMGRTTEDIDCTWESIQSIIDRQAPLAKYAGPGYWNNPDILQVGLGNLTEEENRSHFSMWCMFAAPLFVGLNLTKMTKSDYDILSNREVIAIDQDPAGIQATRIRHTEEFDVWVKRLGPPANNEWAVALLNRTDTEGFIPFSSQDLGLERSRLHLQDLWNEINCQIRGVAFRFLAPPHGVRMFRVHI